MTNNLWDALTHEFVGDINEEVIPVDAADNILIAWPPILDFIATRVKPPATALDFGCGGGRLVNELRKQGYATCGVDSSPKMIESARRAFEADAFHVSDAETIALLGPFEIVTSVMVLQFVEQAKRVIELISATLSENGIFAFAVHNPDYVQDGVTRGRFPEFVETSRGRRTTLTLGSSVTIPMFIRTAEDYDRIAQPCGLRRALRAEPPFTDEFFNRYGGDRRNPYSEYLILGYEKS